MVKCYLFYAVLSVRMEEATNDVLLKQKNELSELLKCQLSDEKIWYLIDVRWFKQWKKYVGFDDWETSMVGENVANPGPIDNSMLFNDGTNTLKGFLTDELDYVLVPREAWERLVSWYGLSEGQEPLKRHVIEQGMFVKHHKVEVYFLELKLSSYSDLTRVVTKEFSHADTIAELEAEMCRIFNIPEKRPVQLYNCYAQESYEPLNRPNDNTLQDAGLYSGQSVIIEACNEDGTWPRPRQPTKPSSLSTMGSSYIPKGSISSGSSASASVSSASSATSNTSNNRFSMNNKASSNSMYSYDGYRSSSAGPGLCGLGNLGNTCFMNSAIQCMSNVPQLTQYMTEDRWKHELNAENPLGMRGEIASTYAELVKNMWSGKFSYTIPRAFKVSVGRFKPEFSGYQQQDSQELMAFLLDGLHEDLNRIKSKPYVETKEANNRPDKEVANETWSDYIKRNDSIIVDIFHGLLKSTLVCPECSKVSVKFDPFCYLSLPLPVKKERQIEIILIPWDPMKKLTQYKVTVQKMGIISHLCTALSQLTQISPEKMLVVDVYNHRFHKVYSPNDPLNNILERDDIFVYEVPINYMNESNKTALIPVYMREDRSRLFGLPLLIAVKQKGCTYDTLYNCILDRMTRYVRLQGGQNSALDDSERCTAGQGDKLESNGISVTMKSAEESSSDEECDDSEDVEEDISDPDVHSSFNRSTHNGVSHPRIFQLSFVNIYGNAEVNRLNDDNKQIKFGHRTFLAAEWNSKSKELHYDDKGAEDLEQDDSMNAKAAPKKQCIQLSECLEIFTTMETLGEHDLWFCPVCKRHQQATKKFDIWQLPRVLVIHLKRFSYTRYWRDKLDTMVDYPTRGLDLSRWVINPDHGPALYDLIAVSNHYGGMGGGHYTASAKNHIDGNWYHFDDSTVSSTTEDSAVTKTGYVLVYMRRDADESEREQPVKWSSTSSAPATVTSASNDTDENKDPVDTPPNNFSMELN